MVVVRAGSSKPQTTNVERLYVEMSARIMKAVINQRTSDWPSYFIGLREVVRRVITETTESGLSAEDRAALLERLMEHITELEVKWPRLA